MARRSVVGIKEIGRTLGVSMMSVSRALRGVEGVSAKTRAEILRTAKRMGYRPNRNARSLATANSTLIGISLPTLFSDVFPEILDGMRTAFDRAGYDTVIDTTDYDSGREESWVERMLDWNAAGVVLSGVHHAPQLRKRLRSARMPTLEIWDISDDPIDLCVGIDHAAAGHQLGSYLVGCGYRKPAFVGVPLGRDPRADKRLSGMVAAFDQAGTAAITQERINMRAGFQAGLIGTNALLGRNTGIPDVICYLNDHLAVGGIAACQRLGFSVPEMIGIAGFNSLEINAVLTSPITTIVTPRRVMGETGARNLVARINGAKVARCVTVPVEMLVGATTARHRGSA